MAKKRNPEPIAAEDAVKEIQDFIDKRLISDRDIEWEDCADSLEDLASWCADWARQVRDDNK